MHVLSAVTAIAAAALASTTALAAPTVETTPAVALARRWDQPIAPRVMIVSMFQPEDVWTESLGLTENITLPGASPIYPNVTCNPCGQICHIITGEAEINAATTMTALTFSPLFDLRKTYFLIAGIAGVNPYEGTTGSAFFARYTVQVALAYELDARQIPANWTTGYWLYGTTAPGQPATQFYGTEVFEVNTNLLARALDITKNVQLNDSSAAVAYRAKYDYAPANQPPTIKYGDGATSDVYYAGNLLAEAFGNITKLFTNGTGTYAHTAQEDSATAEAILRADRAGLADLSRLIIMRTASDFDRAPSNVTDAYAAFEADQGGFEIAIENLFVAGNPVVQAIVDGWDNEFAAGIKPQENFTYSADEFHSLTFKEGEPAPASRKRSLRTRSRK